MRTMPSDATREQEVWYWTGASVQELPDALRGSLLRVYIAFDDAALLSCSNFPLGV